MHWIRLTFLLRMTILGCLLPIACIANDMCSAEEDISFLVNRPANAVSPCTVKKGYFLTEAGYQRRNWSTGGNADVFPVTQIRLGLPKTSEIYAYLPIYVGNHAPPFAGNTTIAYSLPFSGNVTIEIRNSMGETVETLVNEIQTAGDHSLKLTGGGLPQGVYTAAIRLSNNTSVVTGIIKLVVSK